MASITKRGSKWQYRVSWRDVDGKQHSKNKSGFRTKTDAANEARGIEEKLTQGVDILKSDTLLADFFHEWYTTYCTDLASGTLDRFALYEKILRKRFPETKLNEMAALNWQQFINDYQKTRRKLTVRNLNSAVSRMAAYAVDTGIIFRNFASITSIGGDSGPSKENKFLQLDQFTALVEYAKERSGYDNQAAEAIYLAAQTGMRAGEVLGLSWKDVDFDAGLIRVRHSYTYRTKTFDNPKTVNGIRSIEVTPALIANLKKYQVQQREYYLSQGIRDSTESVFRNKAGQIITQVGIRRVLLLYQTAVGIPDDKRIPFHGLRHTHVSYLISKGVDIYYISHRLGHASPAITLRVYSHLLENHRKQEASRATAALSQL